MQQNRSLPRAVRRCVAGATGLAVASVAVFAGGSAAFAAGGMQVGDFTSLDGAFQQAGVTEIDVTKAIKDSPHGVLTLAPSNNTILDLQGNAVDVGRIQLTSVVQNTAQGATLTIVDSVGGGLLTVDNSLATGAAAAYAAIEVDADPSSALNIQGASVTALASTASNATAAGIGGGTWNGLSGASGAISINDYNGVHSTVTATGSHGGAAIGDGTGAGAASVNVNGHASVVATAPAGSLAAAIGGGDSPQSGRVSGPSVHIDDYATVSSVSYGAGAAIGGGRFGAGGSVTIEGQAQVSASGAGPNGQAGIGDGASSAPSRSTSVVVTGAAHVDAVGGAAGGAAIGGGVNSYGGDSLTTSAGTRVTLAAAPGVTAFGAPSGAVFGTLSNSGALILAGGSTMRVPSGAAATSDGTFENNGTISIAGSFTNGGVLSNNGVSTVTSGGVLVNSNMFNNTGTVNGFGTVSNGGTIVQSGTFAPSAVTGNAFRLVYDGQGGSKSASTQLVYADTAAAAGLMLATATPSSTGTFTGWNTQPDGTGSFLTSSDSIGGTSGTSATGSPADVNIYAIYQIAPVLGGGTLPQAVVGTSYAASVAASSGTAPITYSKSVGDLPAGLTLDADSGAITGTPTTAGTFTMTVGAANAFTRQRGAVTHDYTIQVVPKPITLSVPATAKGTTRYLAGSSATLTIGGLQANETYVVSIGGKTAATGKAASNSAFTKKVTVPKSIGDGSQTVKVTGSIHALAATAKILTASVSKSLGLKTNAKHGKVKHGKKITVSVSKLYAGESVRVVISGKHGKTAVGKATSKGTYVVTLKKGLAKGKYKVTVTGAGTSRKASAKLTVS